VRPRRWHVPCTQRRRRELIESGLSCAPSAHLHDTPELFTDLESVTWTARRSDLQDEPTLPSTERAWRLHDRLCETGMDAVVDGYYSGTSVVETDPPIRHQPLERQQARPRAGPPVPSGGLRQQRGLAVALRKTGLPAPNIGHGPCHVWDTPGDPVLNTYLVLSARMRALTTAISGGKNSCASGESPRTDYRIAAVVDREARRPRSDRRCAGR